MHPYPTCDISDLVASNSRRFNYIVMVFNQTTGVVLFAVVDKFAMLV